MSVRYYAEAVSRKSPRVTASHQQDRQDRRETDHIFFSKFLIIKLDNASAMTHNLRIALSYIVCRSASDLAQGLNHQARGFVVPEIDGIFYVETCSLKTK